MSAGRADRAPQAERPAILVVHPATDARDRVAAELGRRYALDYEIVAGADADAAAAESAGRATAGRDIALVLAGDPDDPAAAAVTLGAVAAHHPHARRALLIDFGAWGDAATAQTVLQAMARGVMDYYVLIPWRSPDELFHRTVAEFLHEWSRAHGEGPRELTVVGPPDGPGPGRLRTLLTRNGIPHACLAPHDPLGARLLEAAGLPPDGPTLVAFHDGRTLVDPGARELAEAFGFRTAPARGTVEVAIVGAGPAGLAAAVYAAADGLDTLVVEREAIGGQAGSSSLIRNYLGFARGVSGADLAMRAYQQAWVFGASIVMMRSVEEIARDRDHLALTLDGGERVRARAVILSGGVSYRRLDVPELEALIGAGVHYGASIAEAPAYAGGRVHVLGGGNSAGQAALHLARYAAEVSIVVRGPSLEASMSRYLIDQIAAHPRIRVLARRAVAGGGGAPRLTELVLRHGDHEERVPSDALFVLIGARPHTEWLPPAIARDRWGFVLTGADVPGAGVGHPRFATGMPGVYAAGDVRHGSVKRVGSAVGEGAGVVGEVFAHVRGGAEQA